MNIQDNINYLNRQIKLKQRYIDNNLNKLEHLKKIAADHPNCNILTSKEIEEDCLDKCNKIKIYNAYNGGYIRFYYLSNDLKIFNTSIIQVFYTKTDYSHNNHNSFSRQIFCTVEDYVSIFPESFPKRNYWIKKIEKFIIKAIIKNNYNLKENSFNYDKIQGYMIFA